jgi:hypothetical protein
MEISCYFYLINTLQLLRFCTLKPMGPAAASIFDNISFAGSLDANLVSRLTEPYYRIKESESHG